MPGQNLFIPIGSFYSTQFFRLDHTRTGNKRTSIKHPVEYRLNLIIIDFQCPFGKFLIRLRTAIIGRRHIRAILLHLAVPEKIPLQFFIFSIQRKQKNCQTILVISKSILLRIRRIAIHHKLHGDIRIIRQIITAHNGDAHRKRIIAIDYFIGRIG